MYHYQNRNADRSDDVPCALSHRDSRRGRPAAQKKTPQMRRGQSTGEDCFAQKEGVLHSAVSVCSLKDDNVVTPLGPWDHLRLGDAAVITEHSR